MTAEGLHRIGAIDKLTMREFDVMCLTTVEKLSAREYGESATEAPARSSVPRHGVPVSRPKRARFRARARAGIQCNGRRSLR